MNKIIKLTLIMALVATWGVALAGAQEYSGTGLYVKTVYIERISPHQLGYRVQFLTSRGTIETTYLPIGWFSGTAGKGELVYGEHPSIPYMDIIYEDGKFRTVRLHVSPNYDAPEWTIFPKTLDAGPLFNIETLQIKY